MWCLTHYFVPGKFIPWFFNCFLSWYHLSYWVLFQYVSFPLIFIFCFQWVSFEKEKKKHKVGWVGKWEDLERIGEEVNMVKIHCMKNFKISKTLLVYEKGVEIRGHESIVFHLRMWGWFSTCQPRNAIKYITSSRDRNLTHIINVSISSW